MLVLTCSNFWTRAFARIGDLDLDDNLNDGASPVDAPIDQVVPHPQYSTNPMQNDIALIHLKNPVQFTGELFTYSVCLLMISDESTV